MSKSRISSAPGACNTSHVAYSVPVSTERQGQLYTPCFVAGTLIKTDAGEVPAEQIVPGMRALTRDNGYQTVVWAGQRSLQSEQLAAAPHLMPVRIRAGALGPGLPEADLSVSPQHRMLLSNPQIRKWFQSDEVLIAAEHMLCYPGIDRAELSQVTYVHFMFEQHEIVLANGSWSESFQPRDMRVGSMDSAHRAEILEIFPELEDDCAGYEAARLTLSPAAARVIEPLVRKA